MLNPEFPTLAWNCPPSLFDTAKARGVNTLIGCAFEGSTTDTPANRLAWANAAAAKGFWVIGDFAACASMPANLYAHLLIDEMDAKEWPVGSKVYHGWPHDQIRPLYDAFKKLHPTIPVAMTCAGTAVTQANRLAYYQSIADCSDIWISDGYPRSSNALTYTEALWPGQAVAVLKQAAPNKPVFALIESGWQHLKNSPNGRAPVAAETQAAIGLAISHGASGIGYFSHWFDGNGAWKGFDNTLPDVAAVITQQFKSLNPTPLPAPIPVPVAHTVVVDGVVYVPKQ